MRFQASTYSLSRLLMIKALVFDWDGCLLNNFSATYQTYRSILLDYGIELDGRTFKQIYKPDWYKFYRKLGLPRSFWDKIDDEWDKRYWSFKTRLRKNAFKILESLHDSYVLVLLTGGTRERILKELNTFDLRKFFSFIVCREDSEKKKPNPEPLSLSLKLAGVKPIEALYIGDTYDDVAMGCQVGCITVLIQSNYTSTPSTRIHPDFMLRNLTELLQLVNEKR